MTPSRDASEKILFHIEDIDFQIEGDSFLADWLMSVATLESKDVDCINFIFCSDKYLHQMNVEYLNHDTYTDVITFPYSENPVEGDIFISIERVKENAISFTVPFEQELHRVMVHGVLHLLGYLDKNVEDKKLMTSKENEFLSQLSIMMMGR